MFIYLALFLLLAVNLTLGFAPVSSSLRSLVTNKGASLNMVFGDLAASLAIATQLNTQPMSALQSRSMPMAKVETKQGMYKEYTVETVDDSYLDQVRRGYKTADETEDSKDKYWAILAVLLFGSFAIPMVQYYWYVAEED